MANRKPGAARIVMAICKGERLNGHGQSLTLAASVKRRCSRHGSRDNKPHVTPDAGDGENDVDEYIRLIGTCR